MASSFVIILRTQFKSEMGLKSFTVVGLFVLGIRVMKELFIDCRSRVPLKKIKAKAVEIYFNCFPAAFDEVPIKPVWAWCFIRRHLLDDIINLLNCEGSE